MKTPELKSAHVLLLTGFALAGCAMVDRMGTPPPQPLPVNCMAGDCKVKITVGGCDKTKIHPDRDPLVVDPNYRGPIHWDLATNGYSFAANGIDIQQGNDGEFDGKSPAARQYEWNNKHNNRKIYKYDINVVPDHTTGIVCTYDPSIMN